MPWIVFLLCAIFFSGVGFSSALRCFECDTRDSDSDLEVRRAWSRVCSDSNFTPLNEMVTDCPEYFYCATIKFPMDTKRFCSLYGSETCTALDLGKEKDIECYVCNMDFCNGPPEHQKCSLPICFEESIKRGWNALTYFSLAVVIFLAVFICILMVYFSWQKCKPKKLPPVPPPVRVPSVPMITLRSDTPLPLRRRNSFHLYDINRFAQRSLSISSSQVGRRSGGVVFGDVHVSAN